MCMARFLSKIPPPPLHIPRRQHLLRRRAIPRPADAPGLKPQVQIEMHDALGGLVGENHATPVGSVTSQSARIDIGQMKPFVPAK